MFALAAAAALSQQLIEVELHVNRGPATPVVVIANVDGEQALDVLVPAAALCEVELCGLPSVDIAGERMVALGALSPKLRWVLDASTRELWLTIDPAMFPGTQFAVGETRAPRDLEYVRATSAFVNYALDIASDATVLGFVEAGATLGGAFVSTTLASHDTAVTRGLSSVAWDLRARRIRLSAGDGVIGTGPLGGTAVLGGVHIARVFSLDPYYVATPTFATSGVATTPSTVEVYVDGRLVERRAVNPGAYAIDRIPSAGNSSVVVRDALGRRSEVAVGPRLPQGLLAPGVHEFADSAGFVRDLATSFGYDRPALAARHRLGITNQLTLGMRAEATGELASGGVSATIAAGALLVELSLAASTDGGAGQLALSHLSKRAALRLFARGASEHYATLDLAPEHDRPLSELGALGSAAVTARASIVGEVAASHLRDAGDQARARIGAAWQLDHVRLDVAGSWLRDRGSDEFVATASLALVFGDRTGATVNGSSRGRLAASAYRTLPAGDGVGGRLDLDASGRAMGELTAQAAMGTSTLRVERAGGRTRAQLGITGGLVAIGGRVAATRRIDEGFALVRVPGVAGVNVLREGRRVGVTDDEGDLIVPNLLANYGNRISIDPSNVPLDRIIDTASRTIAPPFRGGAIVEFAAVPVTGGAAIVRGVLAELALGEISVGGVATPIGKRGEIELVGLAPGVHRARAIAGDRACTVLITIPRFASTTVDLGALSCEKEATR